MISYYGTRHSYSYNGRLIESRMVQNIMIGYYRDYIVDIGYITDIFVPTLSTI